MVSGRPETIYRAVDSNNRIINASSGVVNAGELISPKRTDASAGHTRADRAAAPRQRTADLDSSRTRGSPKKDGASRYTAASEQ